MISMQRSAIPRLIAASVSRSISRFRIMCVSPPPTSPSTFSAGTSQSSKMSSLIEDARIPIFLITWPERNPLHVLSTTNAVTRPSIFA